MKKTDLIKLIAMGALIVVAYIPTFIWMYDRWMEKDTYYSHGFLIPFICAFIIWLKKDKLSALQPQPSNIGWLIFIPALAIHMVSAALRVYFSSGFSLLFVLAGFVLLVLGKKYLRQLLFPICVLSFMIPLPLVAIANISLRLKILAAQVSTEIVNFIGIAAVRDGSVIKTKSSYLLVEDPCSGIRSLIAMIALGALMAYFSNISRAKKLLLFATSIPIAVASNVFRIVALTIAAEIYGSDFATGTFHDMMGIVVFVFAFFGLMLVGRLLE